MTERGDLLGVTTGMLVCFALGVQIPGLLGALLFLVSAGLALTSLFLILAAIALGDIRWPRAEDPIGRTPENQVLRVWRTLPDVRPEPFSRAARRDRYDKAR